MNDNKCFIVNNGVFLGPKGNITPCCLSDYSFGNITDTNIEDAFYNNKAKKFRKNFQNGIYDKDCMNCIQQKNNHRYSRNITYAGLKHKDSKLIHVELNLSNTCNAQCNFCSPKFSHLWAKTLNQKHWNFGLTEEQCINLVSSLKDAKTIVLKGGEPFFYGYIDIFLQQLYKINPDVRISCLSNGISWKESTLRIFSKFQNKHVAISAEGIGDMYRYLRGGKYTFENVLESIDLGKKYKIFKKKNIVIASHINFWNIDVYTEQHIKMSNILKQQHKLKTILSIDIARHPHHSTIFLKTLRYRKKIYKQIKKNFKESTLTPHFLEDKKFDTNIKENIKYFNNLRNMDILQINPLVLENNVT